ncbi:hypothetical protein [Streptomyces sp. A1-5]|uniref:hypothetical protein n=1 Tax=Streptomyces sp. A1-5 TaxID=2738410 RepID=UPI001F42EA7F|nr:hypothetical protein [Streptomyces sp. A1-5]UJB43600.1 hypothetical protein HRD51_24890 [Streptomyces sp. A1-5]
MTESLVSLADFEARLPEPLTANERRRCELLLQDASDLVREEVAPVAVPEPPPLVVRQLVMDLAGRVLTNPRGITTENIGDYSYSLARSAINGMALMPAEREALYRCLGLQYVASVPMQSGPAGETVRQATPTGWADGEQVTWGW